MQLAIPYMFCSFTQVLFLFSFYIYDFTGKREYLNIVALVSMGCSLPTLNGHFATRVRVKGSAYDNYAPDSSDALTLAVNCFKEKGFDRNRTLGSSATSLATASRV